MVLRKTEASALRLTVYCFFRDFKIDHLLCFRNGTSRNKNQKERKNQEKKENESVNDSLAFQPDYGYTNGHEIQPMTNHWPCSSILSSCNQGLIDIQACESWSFARLFYCQNFEKWKQSGGNDIRWLLSIFVPKYKYYWNDLGEALSATEDRCHRLHSAVVIGTLKAKTVNLFLASWKRPTCALHNSTSETTK
jgi:hypothetical protein